VSVKRASILFSAVFFTILAISMASAQVIFKTIPAQNMWVADGTSVYRMDVYADSSSESTPVKGTVWSIIVPYSNSIHLVSSSLPVTGYFYEGWSMENEQIASTVDNGFIRINVLNAADDGPLGRTGYLGSYWFTVDTTTPKGLTQFNFEAQNTYYIDPISDTHPVAMQSKSFRIISKPVKTAVLAEAIPDIVCTFPHC